VAEAVSFPPTLQRLQRRTVRVLVVAQLLGACGLAAGGTAGALLAEQLTGSPAAAGLPLSVLVLGSGVGAVVITHVMSVHGRRLLVLAAAFRPDDTHLHKRLLQAVRDRSRTPYEAGANHTQNQRQPLKDHGTGGNTGPLRGDRCCTPRKPWRATASRTSSARLSTLGWSPGYGRSNAPAERPSGQPRYQP
jgi:hypothetical protein